MYIKKKGCMSLSTLSWQWFEQVLVQIGQLGFWAGNVLLKLSFTEPFEELRVYWSKLERTP